MRLIARCLGLAMRDHIAHESRGGALRDKPAATGRLQYHKIETNFSDAGSSLSSAPMRPEAPNEPGIVHPIPPILTARLTGVFL